MHIAVLMNVETLECGFSYIGLFTTREDCEAWCYIQNTDLPSKGSMKYIPQYVVVKDWFNAN